MKVQTSFCKNKQWSIPLRTELDSANTLLLCFYDPQLDVAEALQDLTKSFPRSQIVGCSTAGEIYDTNVMNQSLTLAIVKFESTSLKVTAMDIADGKDSFSVGQKIGEQLKAPDLRYIFILSDGLNVNGTDLSLGMTSAVSNLYRPVVVSGGLSADGSRFQSTSTAIGSQIQSKQIVAVGLFGSLIEIGTGSFGGWDVFGPKRKITLSSGNILKTIDDQPALALYKTYLGEQSAKLPASALLFPLAISDASRSNIVRTVLAVDEQTQTMTFAGDIPQGATVQLMRANFTGLIKGAAMAGQTAAAQISVSEQESLAIAISCVGRRLVLGERIEDETEALKDVLPANTQIVGFYSYGELSSSGQKPCELHNQTMTVSVLQETG